MTRLALALLALGATATAQAQSLRGSGTRATQAFPLVAGIAVFEVQHRGEAPFQMRLVDEQGQVVDEIASGVGAFGGSKAVRIPATGRYLVNVVADGDWSVRVRTGETALDAASDPTADSAMAAGRTAGRAAAGRPGTGGWFAKGLLGGLLLGPVGTAIVASSADRGADQAATAAADALAPDRMDYTVGYREGFADRLRQRRLRASLTGGIIGTAVLATVIISAITLRQGAQVNGGNGGDPPLPLISIPLPR